MPEKTTVVTPQRFDQGFSYEDYLAQIKVNKLRFQQYYDEFDLDKAELERFRSLTRTSIAVCRLWPSWPTAPA